MQPYLDSKFVMGGVEEASHPGVIFASRRDLPFRKWLCQWMRHLISQATGTVCTANSRANTGVAMQPQHTELKGGRVLGGCWEHAMRQGCSMGGFCGF